MGAAGWSVPRRAPRRRSQGPERRRARAEHLRPADIAFRLRPDLAGPSSRRPSRRHVHAAQRPQRRSERQLHRHPVLPGPRPPARARPAAAHPGRRVPLTRRAAREGRRRRTQPLHDPHPLPPGQPHRPQARPVVDRARARAAHHPAGRHPQADHHARPADAEPGPGGDVGAARHRPDARDRAGAEHELRQRGGRRSHQSAAGRGPPPGRHRLLRADQPAPADCGRLGERGRPGGAARERAAHAAAQGAGGQHHLGERGAARRRVDEPAARPRRHPGGALRDKPDAAAVPADAGPPLPGRRPPGPAPAGGVGRRRAGRPLPQRRQSGAPGASVPGRSGRPLLRPTRRPAARRRGLHASGLATGQGVPRHRNGRAHRQPRRGAGHARQLLQQRGQTAGHQRGASGAATGRRPPQLLVAHRRHAQHPAAVEHVPVDRRR